MRGFDLYQTHNAFNLHFNNKNNYRFFDYNGKTRVTEESLKKSPFRWQYAGLEPKINHLLWFMYSIYKESDWSYIPPKSLFFKGRTWLQKNQYQHPVDYMNEAVREDLQWLRSEHAGSTSLFDRQGLYPAVYQHYTQHHITLETLLLIETHIKCVLVNENSEDIVSWPMVINQMKLIQPFVEHMFDRYEFEHMFAKVYLSAADK